MLSKDCGTLFKHWPVSEHTKIPFLSFFYWDNFSSNDCLKGLCFFSSGLSFNVERVPWAGRAFPPGLAASRRLSHSIERVLGEDRVHTRNLVFLKVQRQLLLCWAFPLCRSAPIWGLWFCFWILQSQFCRFEVDELREASPNKQTMSNIKKRFVF